MYVIYTKTGCVNCEKAKELLSNEEKIIINCDLLIKHNREEFVKSMELKTRKAFKQFPLIFCDDLFVGGYDELAEHLNFEFNLLDSDF